MSSGEILTSIPTNLDNAIPSTTNSQMSESGNSFLVQHNQLHRQQLIHNESLSSQIQASYQHQQQRNSRLGYNLTVSLASSPSTSSSITPSSTPEGPHSVSFSNTGNHSKNLTLGCLCACHSFYYPSFN